MSTFALPNLPLELVIHILCYLTIPDLVSCQLAHSSLCGLVRTSILIRFNKATEAAGIDANPHYRRDRSVKERLGLLRRLERGWSDFNVDFTKKIALEHSPSGVYGLTGGMCVLGDKDRHSLHCCALPLTAADEPECYRVDVGGEIVGVGMARYEHDLLAVVTSTPQDDIFRIEVRLLELSSGEPHPHARHPALFVVDSAWSRPEVAVEVVGDNLALVVTHSSNEDRPADHFYIYEWKTGVVKMHVAAPNGSYSCMLFLSPDILLLPNSNSNAFEFWEIPSSADHAPTQPLGALGLPSLDPGYVMTRVSCRCEPNPSVYGTPFSPQPFQSSPLDAIAMFTIHIQPPNVPSGVSFMIFVHRRSLLHLCPRKASAPEATAVESTPLKPVATPWLEWGPSVTRCFNLNSLVTRWVTTAAGQRYAIFLAGSASLVFLDFNPVRIRRLGLERARERPGEPHIIPRESGSVKSWFETKPNTIRHHAFVYPVVSCLPYMVCSLDKAHGYDGVLMDEHRLLGLQTDEMGKITDIEILQLGLGDE